MSQDEFITVYTAKLRAAIERKPDDYMDTPATAHITAAKMVQRIAAGTEYSVNLGGALKSTLRHFKLPTTYKGLKQARDMWGAS